MAPLSTDTPHTEVFARLMRAKQNGRLGHSLLLTGGGGHGAYVFALRLAEQFLGIDVKREWSALFNHPDFLCISPLPPKTEMEKRGKDKPDPVIESLLRDPHEPINVGSNWRITADQGRRLVQWTALSPWQSDEKFVLIAEAEKTKEDAADIMLKTLEEPQPGVTIVLVTMRPQDLLPTVRSRCHETSVPPLDTENIAALLIERGAREETAHSIARLAQGDFWQASALSAGDTNELRRDAAKMIVVALDPKERVADIMGDIKAVTDGMSPTEISEYVRWMIWWLRDLILAVEGLQPPRPEVEPALDWARKVGFERLTEWLVEADRSYEMLGRNVTPEAVVAALTLYPRDQRRLGTEPTFPPLDVVVSHR